MEVKGITLVALRNGEYLQFGKDVLDLVNREPVVATAMMVPAMNLQAGVATLEALFKTDRGNALTAAIEQLDQRRDNALIGISKVIDGFAYHFSPAYRYAAQTLQHHLGIYGSAVVTDNYQSETASIQNILNDWDTKSDLINAMNMLSLNDWKNELRDANGQFGSLYLNRTQDLASVPLQTIKETRLAVSAAYYNLRDRIVAYNLLNEQPAAFVKTITELNKLVDQYNVVLAGRINDAAAPDAPPAA